MTRFDKYDHEGAYHWARVSRSWRRHDARYAARYQAVTDAIGDAAGLRVLDLGCGDGVLTWMMHERGAQATGVDLDGLGLRLGQRELRLRGAPARLVQADAHRLPFAAGAFDCVICTEVLEHIETPDRLLAEAARVLESGGLIVVTTPNRLTETPEDPLHLQEYYPGEVVRMLGRIASDIEVRFSHPVALLELNAFRPGSMRRRPFRYLFNFLSLLGRNVFRLGGFRLHGLIVAKGVARRAEAGWLGEAGGDVRPAYGLGTEDVRGSRPRVVCLCGSTRFGQAFREANLSETLAGRIVLTVGCDMHSDAETFADLSEEELAQVKARLDELHLRKIDLADEILVLNVGGYVGSSTSREIEYARATARTIRWLEAPVSTG